MLGNPSVVREAGLDAPEGANTGFDAVVSDAGADTEFVCARTAGTSITIRRIDKTGEFKLKANIVGAND
ncbi:hypothetical protein GCM10027190_23180 [Spirosoma areae]